MKNNPKTSVIARFHEPTAYIYKKTALRRLTFIQKSIQSGSPDAPPFEAFIRYSDFLLLNSAF
jgi:hypothetical protein